jgi:hypothetical protein
VLMLWMLWMLLLRLVERGRSLRTAVLRQGARLAIVGRRVDFLVQMRGEELKSQYC